uniref:site-specific DNA-methyltransferase n=6 Tax=Neisseria dentiae TaxID=194197 RepID=UPI0035A13644
RTEPNRNEPNRTEPNRTEIIHENQNNFKQNKILQLKQLFPEIFCEEQIDFEKLKLVLGEDNLCAQNERYQLGWAGKSDAYRTLQSPTFNTLAPCVAESVNFHDTQNVFIEAENLEALKILQKSYAGKVKMIYIDPPYNTGSDSFVYPDKFAETREEYAKRVGDKDQDGYLLRDGAFAGAWRKNSKDNGHYHSNWLSMMLPRLHLAKTLLREDGVIFISIDDHEQAQLKLLCDEVFGAENFVATLIWKNGRTSAAHFTHEHENIICYAKSKVELELFKYDGEACVTDRTVKKPSSKNPLSIIEFPAGIEFESEDKVFPNIIGDKEPIKIVKGKFESKNRKLAQPVSLEAAWTMADMIRNWLKGEEVIDQKGQKVRRFFFKSNGVLQYEKEKGTFHPKTIITEFTTKQGSNVLIDLLEDPVFDFPKPPSLVAYLVSFVCSNKNDLILDFFSGSGTTAHAVMQLNAEDGGNRRYICVQLAEETDENSEARKAGFANIAEIAKERIRRAGAQIRRSGIDARQNMPSENADTAAGAVSGINARPTVDTGFKVFKLTESHFKQWRRPLSGSLNEQQQLALLEEFQNIVHENAGVENMAYELMLRLGFELTDSIEFADNVVWLNNAAQTRKTALLLDTVNQAVLDEVRAQSPKKVFVLDKAFAGDDALKTNAALQFKDADIDFETL